MDFQANRRATTSSDKIFAESIRQGVTSSTQSVTSWWTENSNLYASDQNFWYWSSILYWIWLLIKIVLNIASARNMFTTYFDRKFCRITHDSKFELRWEMFRVENWKNQLLLSCWPISSSAGARKTRITASSSLGSTWFTRWSCDTRNFEVKPALSLKNFNFQKRQFSRSSSTVMFIGLIVDAVCQVIRGLFILTCDSPRILSNVNSFSPLQGHQSSLHQSSGIMAQKYISHLRHRKFFQWPADQKSVVRSVCSTFSYTRMHIQYTFFFL